MVNYNRATHTRMSKVIIIFFMPFFLNFLNSCATTVVGKRTTYSQSVASYYHDKFHGRKTASGAIYNKNKLTVAHKTLPFGTKVEIVNLENNKKVIVTVTDRGPFIAGREFDLSKRAFKQIAPLEKGVINIKYRIL